jgi:hypothetical protein
VFNTVVEAALTLMCCELAMAAVRPETNEADDEVPLTR